MPRKVQITEVQYASKYQCLYEPNAAKRTAAPVCLIGKCEAVLIKTAERRLRCRGQLPRKCAQCLSTWIKIQETTQ